MTIRLLTGFFGSYTGYALMGYENVPIGVLNGDVPAFVGEVNSGGCSFGNPSFGQR